MSSLMRIAITGVFLAAIVLVVFSLKSGGNVETRHPCNYGDCNLEAN